MFAKVWFLIWLLALVWVAEVLWQESAIWQSVVELPQWFVFAIGFALSVFGISLFWQILAEIAVKKRFSPYGRSLELSLGMREREIRKMRKIVRQRRFEYSLLSNFFSIGALVREQDLRKKSFPWGRLAVWKSLSWKWPQLRFAWKAEGLRLKWKKG